MFYLKIKKILENILPLFLFNTIINIWRNIFIQPKNQIKRIKLRKFKNKIYKKISINNMSYFLKLNPLNWYVDNELFLKWIYEKGIFELMYKNINKGDTCIDIWANIWMYTNFWPNLVWKTWKIIWFEPIKRIYEQNLSSIRKNKYENITLYNKACSNKEDKLTIQISENNIWWSSLEGTFKWESEEKILTIIWDKILLKEDKINFIKIDTEWHEWKVLQGIEKTIKKFTPKIIIEFSPYLFSEENDWKKILAFFIPLYSNVYILELNKELNLRNEADIKTYNNLINERQVNLYFK